MAAVASLMSGRSFWPCMTASLMLLRGLAAAFDTAVDMFDAHPSPRDLPVVRSLRSCQLLASGLLRGLDDVHPVQRKRLKTQVLQQLASRRQWVRRGVGDALVMDTARMRLTQEEDAQGLIDQQEIVQHVALFLAAYNTFSVQSRSGGAGWVARCHHDNKGDRIVMNSIAYGDGPVGRRRSLAQHDAPTGLPDIGGEAPHYARPHWQPGSKPSRQPAHDCENGGEPARSPPQPDSLAPSPDNLGLHPYYCRILPKWGVHSKRR